MLTETRTPVRALIEQCQRLAEGLFDGSVCVRFELLPSLDGDSYRANVRGSLEPTAAGETLLSAPPGRGKLGALRELLQVLRTNRPSAESPC